MPAAVNVIVGAFAAGLATLASASAASAGPSPRGRDLPEPTLRIGVQSSGNSAAKALLDASGVFADAPYKIAWADFSGADGAVEALSAGAIDLDVGLNFSAPVLGQANASPAWTATSRPYVIIGADLQLDRDGTAILVHPNSRVKSVGDLAGKSVSFAKGTANHYFLAIAARQANLDLSKINPVQMPLTEARAAFIGGSVDGLVTAVSNARPLITNGDAVVLKTSAGLYDSYSWFVARPAVLNDPAERAATADVLVRLQRANLWNAAHLDKVAAIFASEAHQSAQDAAKNAVANVSSYVPIDAKTIAGNQDQANVFRAAGVIANEIDASIEFDDRFNALVSAHPGPSRADAAPAAER